MTDDDGRRTTTTDDDDGRRTTDDDGRRRRRRRRRRTTDDDGNISKNIFKPCHHIESNTTNPNPIFKITISFTKTQKKPKHCRKKRFFGKISKIQNFQKPKNLFCILYTFHNSYFLFCLVLEFLKNLENFQNPKTQFFIWGHASRYQIKY